MKNVIRQIAICVLVAVAIHADQKPAPAPARWIGVIGEYELNSEILIVFENDGKLYTTFKRGTPEVLPDSAVFTRDRSGRATTVKIHNTTYQRRRIEPEAGTNQLRVSPVRPVPELIKEALVATPPAETGDFLKTDLVELIKLDPTIRLDVRYATTNNLFGTVFYSEPRAFLQRPAAESLARVNSKLKPLGYGLLVHDAYRPWYVTKVFWDATPADKKLFVADPSQGSRHNRGCAVDLTLYVLKTKKPVEMVSTYDETTDRAYPDYPGGTSLQRWHRDLLRAAMEAEGFKVYPAEWWHFDFNDWQKYSIQNIPFNRIPNK